MASQTRSSESEPQLAALRSAAPGRVEPDLRAPGDPFFLVMGALMFVITAVGFAPTFFLRFMFDAPRLPLRLSIHGLLATMWVSLYLVQTVLVRGRRLRWHGWLGLAGGGLGAAMVGSGFVVLVGVARESSGPLPLVAGLVWGNLFILAAFSVFLTLGLLARRRPEAHKRFLLLATLSLMGQPLVRIGQLESLVISEIRMTNDAIYGLGGLLLLLLLAVVHDVWVRGRPHRVIAIGAPALLLGLAVMGVAVPRSAFAQAVVLWLR